MCKKLYAAIPAFVHKFGKKFTVVNVLQDRYSSRRRLAGQAATLRIFLKGGWQYIYFWYSGFLGPYARHMGVLAAVLNKYILSYFSPKYLSYNWVVVLTLGLLLAGHIVAGLLLSFYGKATGAFSFTDIIYTTSGVRRDHIFKYLCSSVAACIFIFLNLHMVSVIYYHACAARLRPKGLKVISYCVFTVSGAGTLAKTLFFSVAFLVCWRQPSQRPHRENCFLNVCKMGDRVAILAGRFSLASEVLSPDLIHAAKSTAHGAVFAIYGLMVISFLLTAWASWIDAKNIVKWPSLVVHVREIRRLAELLARAADALILLLNVHVLGYLVQGYAHNEWFYMFYRGLYPAPGHVDYEIFFKTCRAFFLLVGLFFNKFTLSVGAPLLLGIILLSAVIFYKKHWGGGFIYFLLYWAKPFVLLGAPILGWQLVIGLCSLLIPVLYAPL